MRLLRPTCATRVALISAGVILTVGMGTASAVDWGAVEGQEVILFYPGQSSWEWALTQADHSGNEKFRQGRDCKDCHGGEEKAIGNLIVSGEKLESDPIEGERGWIPLMVKMAHDAEKLYVRLEWPAPTEPVGRRLDPEVEAKATVMLGDGSTTEAIRGGCWGVCHDDLKGMPSDPADLELTKYLAASRTQITRQGGGDRYKPQSELDVLLDEGQFYEYWHAHLNEGQVAQAFEGYILDKRQQSPAESVSVEADVQAGQRVVVFSRPLVPDDPHHKDIVSGKPYFIGFAVHDAYAEGRRHQVSLEYTFVLDEGEADFVVRRQ
jgi:hypothetical protein